MAHFTGHRGTLKWLVADLTPARPIFLWTILSLALILATVEFLRHAIEQFAQAMRPGQIQVPALSPWILRGALLAWSASYLVSTTQMLRFVWRSVKFPTLYSAGQHLAIILASYASVITVSAALYYSTAFYWDFRDAVHKLQYYRDAAAQSGLNHPEQVRPISDKRAFRGIEARFWSGVDWQDNNDAHSAREADQFDPNRLREVLKTAGRPAVDVIRFLPDARPTVLFDCLYFSIVTITTLGYGDITPRTASAKVLANLEVLMGVVLFAIALGMLFSKWGKPAGGSGSPR